MNGSLEELTSSKHPSISSIRARLSQIQIKHLDRIWEYYKEHDHWPSTLEFHRGYGSKKETIEILESIGGNIVTERERYLHNEYYLTLLGLFLLSNGEQNYRILVQYYCYIKSVFEAEGWRETITAEELRRELSFTEEDLSQLYYFTEACWQLPSGGSEGKPPKFHLDMPRDIDDLLDFDVEDFIVNRTFKGFSKGRPVTQKRKNELEFQEHYITQRDLNSFIRDGLLLEEYRKFLSNTINKALICAATIALICVAIVAASAFFPKIVPIPFNERISGIAQSFIGCISAVFGSGFLGLLFKWRKKMHPWVASRIQAHIEKSFFREYSCSVSNSSQENNEME